MGGLEFLSGVFECRYYYGLNVYLMEQSPGHILQRFK